MLLVYKSSLEQGAVPSTWKKRYYNNNSSLYKEQSLRRVRMLIQQTIPANFTYISPSHACKVLGHIVYSHVMSHLEHHNILSELVFPR